MRETKPRSQTRKRKKKLQRYPPFNTKEPECLKAREPGPERKNSFIQRTPPLRIREGE
jgi:hypothetical protein